MPQCCGCLSSVFTECIVAKWCVLQQQLILTAYGKSCARNRLVLVYRTRTLFQKGTYRPTVAPWPWRILLLVETLGLTGSSQFDTCPDPSETTQPLFDVQWALHRHVPIPTAVLHIVASPTQCWNWPKRAGGQLPKCLKFCPRIEI